MWEVGCILHNTVRKADHGRMGEQRRSFQKKEGPPTEVFLFWRALPEKSLSEKAKRCRGGKQANQKLTWAFFVNASGGEEDPIVIWKSVIPRCFKSLIRNSPNMTNASTCTSHSIQEQLSPKFYQQR